MSDKYEVGLVRRGSNLLIPIPKEWVVTDELEECKIFMRRVASGNYVLESFKVDDLSKQEFEQQKISIYRTIQKNQLMSMTDLINTTRVKSAEMKEILLFLLYNDMIVIWKDKPRPHGGRRKTYVSTTLDTYKEGFEKMSYEQLYYEWK